MIRMLSPYTTGICHVEHVLEIRAAVLCATKWGWCRPPPCNPILGIWCADRPLPHKKKPAKADEIRRFFLPLTLIQGEHVP